ncbi:MAG: endolytic transglycosylase MltG [Candidatus Paceibacterota bacterium]
MDHHINKDEGMLNTRFLVLLGVLILFILSVGYFFNGIQPTLADDSSVNFKIEKGDSFRGIGAELSQSDLIKSISVFKIYAIATGSAHKLKPGDYQLSYDMSVPEILGILSQGVVNEVEVIIPEGSTIKDVDFLLHRGDALSEKDSLLDVNISNFSNDYSFLNNSNSLEGFLFPDTYRFERHADPDVITRKMLDNFSDKAWILLEGERNWYDSLILASFLEKEVPELEDRKVVAGLLLKRLGIGMPFQVDATIAYVKCLERFIGCKTVVTRDDLDINSAYNTYERIGWTPTPISNPGEEAIQAALNPIESNYLYYLSDSETKETIFSETLDEHNENRFKHLN